MNHIIADHICYTFNADVVQPYFILYSPLQLLGGKVCYHVAPKSAAAGFSRSDGEQNILIISLHVLRLTLPIGADVSARPPFWMGPQCGPPAFISTEEGVSPTKIIITLQVFTGFSHGYKWQRFSYDTGRCHRNY